MPRSLNAPPWTRHFVYRSEHIRTTWKFRLGLVAFVVVAVWFTGGWWTLVVARSLVCDANAAPSDAILLGTSTPTTWSSRCGQNCVRRAAPNAFSSMAAAPGAMNLVALRTVEMLASLSRLGRMDIVPIREVEPISLNAGRDIQPFIEPFDVRSVIVVSPLFRSRRSALVYAATLGSVGITVRCEPVPGTHGVNSWSRSWHGVEEMAEQFIKLQYYRFYVLPFRRGDSSPST